MCGTPAEENRKRLDERSTALPKISLTIKKWVILVVQVVNLTRRARLRLTSLTLARNVSTKHTLLAPTSRRTKEETEESSPHH